MDNIFATWICIDSDENASWFYSSKGSSSDQKVQHIYWKCLAACMYTARFFNPEVRLVVFSNIAVLPVVDNIDFKELFEKLQVQFYTTPFEFQTPDGYYEAWKNQFYEFSIFRYIISHPDFGPEDSFCLVDSDCIITGDLSLMFSSIFENGSISYDMKYTVSHNINGNTRLDMQKIYSSLLNRDIDTIPVYYAGEFFGARISVVARLMEEFSVLWPKLMGLHQNKSPRLHEEAHVLSFLYHVTGHENNLASQFIKRLWTDKTTYRNVEEGDEKLLIWHLPAEKRYGFNNFFGWLSSRNFSVDSVPAESLMKTAKHMFTIPQIPAGRKAFYVMKSIAKKVVNKK